MGLGGQKVAELALGDEQRGQDRTFRSWTKMALIGLCDAFGIEMPRQVEEKWPFSRCRVRKASWMPHSFRTTNNIDGKSFYILKLKAFKRGKIIFINHFFLNPKIDVKKLHGSTLQNVSLMSTVLVSKKKISQRYCVLTLGFPSNPNIKLQPGDHINVFPENDPPLVRQVIKRLADVPKENEIVVWKGKHADYFWKR